MQIRLEDLMAAVKALQDADNAVADAEASLSLAKERSRLLREETIPSAMQELGLKELRLDTGELVKVAQDVYASIPDANKPEAFRWLTEFGFDGLIKTTVSTEFGRGEITAARAMVLELGERGVTAELNQSIHPQTLKAFLREQIATGATDLPLDLFGARAVFVTKITKK